MIARLAAALLAAAALTAVAAEPVAFVADLQGNATVEGNGRLGFLAPLAEGRACCSARAPGSQSHMPRRARSSRWAAPANSWLAPPT